MKAAILSLWATSLLVVAASIVVAVWHPDKVTVTLAFLNAVITAACTVVASWSREEVRR